MQIQLKEMDFYEELILAQQLVDRAVLIPLAEVEDAEDRYHGEAIDIVYRHLVIPWEDEVMRYASLCEIMARYLLPLIRCMNVEFYNGWIAATASAVQVDEFQLIMFLWKQEQIHGMGG